MRPQPVPVNVYETDSALVVVAPVPAVQPDDVRIDVWPGHLRITAHVRSAPPRTYLVHEWNYGGYERELDVPAGFGCEVDASLHNGQLAVRLRRGDAPEGKVSVTPNAGRSS
jgi:HSP20 family molecular chaperone IbpA